MNIVLKSDKTLYIRLPKEELEETRKIQSTIQLATLIKLQNSLDINLDIDDKGDVVGIEILT